MLGRLACLGDAGLGVKDCADAGGGLTALLTLVNLDRFNAAFGIGSAGFSEGMVCARMEPRLDAENEGGDSEDQHRDQQPPAAGEAALARRLKVG